MKKRTLSRTFTGLFLAIATATSAQESTQTERARALQYLESTKTNIIGATKGLSEAQWNFKPAPDRWSIAQVMEHIAASEDFIRDGLLKEKVIVSPQGPSDRDVKKIDDAVMKMIPAAATRRRLLGRLCPTVGLVHRRSRSNIFSKAARRPNNTSKRRRDCAIT